MDPIFQINHRTESREIDEHHRRWKWNKPRNEERCVRTNSAEQIKYKLEIKIKCGESGDGDYVTWL